MLSDNLFSLSRDIAVHTERYVTKLHNRIAMLYFPHLLDRHTLAYYHQQEGLFKVSMDGSYFGSLGVKWNL